MNVRLYTDGYYTSAERAERMRQVRRAIRDGYAWPGGYHLIVSTDDGSCLCAKCARIEYSDLSLATRNPYHPSLPYVWVGCDIDSDTPCDRCGDQLAAYFDGETDGDA